jgi:hypothetical protein
MDSMKSWSFQANTKKAPARGGKRDVEETPENAIQARR